MSASNVERRWPAQGATRIPYWVYTDPDLYRRELETFFYGPTWNYVGLACEVPGPGDFKRHWIGERNVVMVRGRDRHPHRVRHASSVGLVLGIAVNVRLGGGSGDETCVRHQGLRLRHCQTLLTSQA